MRLTLTFVSVLLVFLLSGLGTGLTEKQTEIRYGV